jgi:hypothetical protein
MWVKLAYLKMKKNAEQITVKAVNLEMLKSVIFARDPISPNQEIRPSPLNVLSNAQYQERLLSKMRLPNACHVAKALFQSGTDK